MSVAETENLIAGDARTLTGAQNRRAKLTQPPRCESWRFFYSKIPFTLLTPALTASSLIILKVPRTPVRSTCGPPQNSFE